MNPDRDVLVHYHCIECGAWVKLFKAVDPAKAIADPYTKAAEAFRTAHAKSCPYAING